VTHQEVFIGNSLDAGSFGLRTCTCIVGMNRARICTIVVRDTRRHKIEGTERCLLRRITGQERTRVNVLTIGILVIFAVIGTAELSHEPTKQRRACLIGTLAITKDTRIVIILITICQDLSTFPILSLGSEMRTVESLDLTTRKCLLGIRIEQRSLVLELLLTGCIELRIFDNGRILIESQSLCSRNLHCVIRKIQPKSSFSSKVNLHVHLILVLLNGCDTELRSLRRRRNCSRIDLCNESIVALIGRRIAISKMKVTLE
jgi:hypothetical protein